jgi:hypothetical protein
VNSQRVLRLSIPEVPSNTWTTARDPDTSRTWPERVLPSPSVRFTISAYLGSLTLSRITRGPFTPAMVLLCHDDSLELVELVQRMNEPSQCDRYVCERQVM